MISHDYKCIYVHIPKAAGTSIVRALSANASRSQARDPNPFADIGNKFEPPPPHLRVEDHVKYGLATREQADSYFKFSFVRNPWDRLVSEYKYRGYFRAHTFKEYLFGHLPKPSWSDWYCHIIPQYDFLFHSDGTQLVDFIGRFENLEQDFRHVCNCLDLPDLQLPHRNTSMSIFNRRDNNLRMMLRSIRDKLNPAARRNTFDTWMEYYDDESREFVAELYKDDIRAFGYSFEP